jgi:hypothetical protein
MILKPALVMSLMIDPIWPFATASGLIMVKVLLVLIVLLISNFLQKYVLIDE